MLKVSVVFLSHSPPLVYSKLTLISTNVWENVFQSNISNLQKCFQGFPTNSSRHCYEDGSLVFFFFFVFFFFCFQKYHIKTGMLEKWQNQLSFRNLYFLRYNWALFCITKIELVGLKQLVKHGEHQEDRTWSFVFLHSQYDIRVSRWPPPALQIT